MTDDIDMLESPWCKQNLEDLLTHNKSRERKVYEFDTMPWLPTLEEWDRLLGTCDLTSKDLSTSNPINKQIIHWRIEPKTRKFVSEDCQFLWGKLWLSWRQTEKWFMDDENPTWEDYGQKEDSGTILEESKSWKNSGKIFPGYEGLGVCRVVWFTNHSCYPNMEVYRIGDTNRIQGK